MKEYLYTGAGNSFVIVEDCPFEHGSSEMLSMVGRLCTVHSRDGVIVAEFGVRGEHPRMTFYNPDGTSGMMCGNGGRCFVSFLVFVKGMGPEVAFMAADGLHRGWVVEGAQEKSVVSLSMSPVSGYDFFEENGVFMNTGTRHLVLFGYDDLDGLDIETEGPQYRNLECFAPQGTNVNFAREEGVCEIRIRTFEKGVEGETLSCGTGVVASALSYAVCSDLYGECSVAVHARGGDFTVDFYRDEDFNDILLTGPVENC